MKYPSGEIIWTGYYDAKGEIRFIVTSKTARDWYYLYEAKDGEFWKLGRDKDPSVLVKKYNVLRSIGC